MSVAARTPLDRRRLAQVLGMLGSAHDGEIAAAGRRASAIIRAAGLSWPEILDPPAPAPWFPPAPLDADTIIAGALARWGQLTVWELGFVRDLAGWRPRGLSDPQLAVLTRIARKLGLRR